VSSIDFEKLMNELYAVVGPLISPYRDYIKSQLRCVSDYVQVTPDIVVACRWISGIAGVRSGGAYAPTPRVVRRDERFYEVTREQALAVEKHVNAWRQQLRGGVDVEVRARLGHSILNTLPHSRIAFDLA
jgi:hypothetical protein